jgi:hypothetical protein
VSGREEGSRRFFGSGGSAQWLSGIGVVAVAEVGGVEDGGTLVSFMSRITLLPSIRFSSQALDSIHTSLEEILGHHQEDLLQGARLPINRG